MKRKILFIIVILVISCCEYNKYPELNGLEKINLNKKGQTVYFGESKKYKKNNITVVYLKGSAFKIGYSHGKLLKEEIRFRIDYFKKTLHKMYWKYVHDISPKLQKFISKDYIDELHGIAKGSGQHYKDIFALSLFSTVALKSEFAGQAPPKECSVFSFVDKKGRIVTGRNLDHMDAFMYKKMVLFIIKPDNGYGFASLQAPGMIDGETVMNEKGVTISKNGISLTQQNIEVIPMTILAREISQHSKNIKDAEKILKKHKRLSPRLLFISSKEGAALFEMCNKKFAQLKMNNQYLAVTNHSRLIYPPYKFSEIDSKERLNHIKKYIQSKKKNLTVKDAIKLLRSPYLIYTRYGNDNALENRQSVIFCPQTLDFWIADVTYPQAKAAALHEYISFNLLDELYGSKLKKRFLKN